MSADSTIVCRLSQLGLLAVRGEDAQTFLQGQLTSDVRQVRHPPWRSQLTAYCSPKGRMLACFRLFWREDTYYLCAPKDVLEATLKRLRMFVLRSKATLDDVSEAWAVIGLAGPRAQALLAEALGEVSAEGGAVTHFESASVLSLPGGDRARFELYGEAAAMVDLHARLADKANPADEAVWRLLAIRAGVPSVYAATVDAFVPQMANLDRLGGVSFDKGCYVGQEIVARTHYLGKLKKRMYSVRGKGDAPAPGTDLFAPALRGEQSVGQIVDAVAGPQEDFEGLAVLVIECADRGEVLLGSAAGRSVTVQALEYLDADAR